MVLPLYGNGTGSIVFDRLKCFHQFDFEEYEKKGKKYLKVVNSSLSIDPEWITFKFDNLYDGDQVLGDNVNLVMNDNWREIFADAQPSIEEASTFIKCDTRKSDFDESLSEAIKNAIIQLDRPMEEYNLPSLEPFFVPFFFSKAGEKPAFESKFKNYRIFGHTKITDLKAT
ncbi:hypothetical protein GEV33_000212 [Tenebrio molitor]|uniref:Uncharacterized protein n=1 Tax=Tenebrio molitor TaxID=7067 RepID=A0A8J6LH76_TENMO|nr:hypothetical protein GEV33_000212 [Tenebrio molitor]